MVPFAEDDGDLVRVWFSARDSQGRSQTGRARVALGPGRPEPEVEPEAVLTPGPLGTFDDSGAMGSCLVEQEGRRYLYYIGWNRGVSVPFYTYVGLAISEDGERFAKVSDAPVIGRNDVDPYLATSPWVMVEDGHWRMWYASGTGWERLPDGTPRHNYHIKYAESDDGVDWRPTGRVCIDYSDESEYAIARPCVVRDRDRYRMWFSHRGESYRIGYAESEDGLDWRRLDREGGLGPSDEGWDSEMIEYPFVLDCKGTRYMLYNGNGYGATGIGYAVLDES
jgi:hypothetical protein